MTQIFRKASTLIKGGRAMVRLVQDPRRLDEVFDLADSVDSEEIFAPIVAAFRASDSGRRGLATYPRVGRLDAARLAEHPEGSLGHAYGRFMLDRGLNPEDLPTRESHDDISWVRAHLFETHDIWHVVTGFGTDVAGELGLQAFYLSQFPARLASGLLAAGLLNTFLYGFEDRARRMDAITAGWELGRRSKSLLGVDWAAEWDTPLADLRARLDIEPITGDLSVAA